MPTYVYHLLCFECSCRKYTVHSMFNATKYIITNYLRCTLLHEHPQPPHNKNKPFEMPKRTQRHILWENLDIGLMNSLAEDLRNLSNTISLDESLRVVCRAINTLDSQGRKDLSLPLRKRFGQCLERGHQGVPCPLLLRLLEKECLAAWSDSFLTANLPQPAVTTEWPLTLYTPLDSVIIQKPFTIERTEELSFTFSLDGSLRHTQHIAILRALIGDTETAETGLKGIHAGFVDIYHRSYDLTLNDNPASLQATYHVHSQVDTLYQLFFSDSSHADLFARHLDQLVKAEQDRSPALTTALRSGWQSLFSEYSIPQDVSASEARALQDKWQLKRHDMIDLYRSFRSHVLDELTAPPLTEERLRTVAEQFWQAFKITIEGQYPGYVAKETSL